MRRGAVQLHLQEIEARMGAVENAIAALEELAQREEEPHNLEHEIEELQEA